MLSPIEAPGSTQEPHPQNTLFPITVFFWQPKISPQVHFLVSQQVTIGQKGDFKPTIGDNVKICAGAIVIGGVSIGNNSIVGAGAVVVKDVPPNEVWAGNPAHFIKKNES